MALHPIKQLAIMDKTKIIPVKKTIPYPAEFLNICEFGVVCEITTDNFQLSVNIYSHESPIIDYINIFD